MGLKRSLIFILLLLITSLFAQAQTWELGGFVGTAGYMGDLNPLNPLQVNKVAFGGQLKRNLDGYWAIRFNAWHGVVEASDARSSNQNYRNRNLSFYSPVTELALQTEFNFFNYIPSFSKKRYSPYLFAGIGFVSFNPKLDLNGNTYELRLYGTEGQDMLNPYKNMALTVPYGAGVKYNPVGKWTLGAELGYRTAYTDYLDDVSRSYAPTKIAADTQNATIRQALADRSIVPHVDGTQRGDFRPRDTYFFLGITISYTFFTEKCPVVDD